MMIILKTTLQNSHSLNWLLLPMSNRNYSRWQNSWNSTAEMHRNSTAKSSRASSRRTWPFMNGWKNRTVNLCQIWHRVQRSARKFKQSWSLSGTKQAYRIHFPAQVLLSSVILQRRLFWKSRTQHPSTDRSATCQQSHWWTWARRRETTLKQWWTLSRVKDRRRLIKSSVSN